MKEITIISENRVGALADICELLGGNGINIESITAYGIGDAGVVRLVTEDVESARRALSKTHHRVIVGDVLVVKLDDVPGALGKLARRLARKGVDIESVYLLSRSKGFTEVAIKTGDLAAAKEAVK
jgi:hypothetical protein